MGKKTVRKYISLYIRRLKDLKPEKVILYGSFLTDHFKEGGSDIDLFVISERFEKLDDDERLKILYRRTVGLPIDFHLYGFTPKEIENVSPLKSLYHALKNGIVISS